LSIRGDNGELENNFRDPKMYNPGWEVTLTRFACVCILHFGLSQETFSAMQLLKFNCLHADRFHSDKSYLAAFAMVLQFVRTLWVEINGILFVLCSTSVTDVIANFLVIEIISQFDDYILFPVIKRRNKHLVEMEFSFKKFSE
jgi:hypothetical protein